MNMVDKRKANVKEDEEDILMLLGMFGKSVVFIPRKHKFTFGGIHLVSFLVKVYVTTHI